MELAVTSSIRLLQGKADFFPAHKIPDGYDLFLEFYRYYVYVLIPLVLAGNSTVVVSSLIVIRSGREPRTSYMCLGNIASADVINSLAILFGLVEFQEMRDKYFCAAQIGCIVSASLTSMLSICLIAIERFLYLVYGHKYDIFVTPHRAWFIICLVWIAGFGFGLLPIIVEAYSMEGRYVQMCEFIRSPTSVNIAAAAIAIPALVVTPLLYTGVYWHIKKLAKRLSTSAAIPTLKFRSFLVVFLSSISFLVCWGPFIVCSFVYKLYCVPRGFACEGLELAVVSPLACLGFTNSLLNPLIYAWWHPPYHNALKKVLCPRLGKVKERPNLNVRTRETFVETIA